VSIFLIVIFLIIIGFAALNLPAWLLCVLWPPLRRSVGRYFLLLPGLLSSVFSLSVACGAWEGLPETVTFV